MTRRQVIRLAAIAVGVVLVVVAALIVPMWIDVLVPAWFKRRFRIGLLQAILGLQFAVLLVAPPVCMIATVLLVRARRRTANAPRAARVVVLCLSCLVGLTLMEAGAARWYVVNRRYPDLPTELADPPGGAPGSRQRTLEILVIGESSGLGIPYDRWLSVAAIVGWQLDRVLPGTRCHINMRAVGGSNLERMHKLLVNQRTRPDCVLIYCGHNEYQARFPWAREVPYYRDALPDEPFMKRFETLCTHTYLGLAIVHALDMQRLGDPPKPAITRALVDVPAFTPAEDREVVENYSGRLEAIVSYCERIRALPIVIVPAGNDGAFEPNRSVVRPETPRDERERFARDFREARRIERDDPERSEVLYRSLLDRQPGFAEAHFRLGRLRVLAGDWPDAQSHLVQARDLDAMPQRCTTPLQDGCRRVGKRHDCVLVDGPAIFKSLTPDGTLDDRLFHDAHHPSFRGYVALAQDIVNQLAERRTFGWPERVPAPRIDPVECARQFGIEASQWTAVCQYEAEWYRNEMFIRHDPSGRRERSRQLSDAARRIEEGAAAEDSGTPGLGCRPDLSRPALGPDGSPL